MDSFSTLNPPQILPEDIREVFAKSKCVYSKAEVESAFDRMAANITAKLSDTNPIFICVVIGGIIPLGNLLPRLDFPLEVDYVHATRYQKALKGRELHWLAKPQCNMKDRTIVIVDDVLDGGVTLTEIIKFCEEAGAKNIYSAVLVDKKDARLEGGLPHADFCGLEASNHYLFGYGMDYKGYLRNAPGIYMVAPEHE